MRSPLTPSEPQRRSFNADEIAEMIGLPTSLRYPALPCESQVKKRVIFHGAPLCGLVHSLDELTLATAGQDNYVRLWSAEIGEFKTKFAGRKAAFAPNGRLLATSGTADDPTTAMI